MKVKFIKPLADYEPSLLGKVFELEGEIDSTRVVVKNEVGGTHWFYKNELELVKKSLPRRIG